jgi:exopolyphosphatase/guanosine-5'-triphosphate,3'-diphosphate pyrophosphatase
MKKAAIDIGTNSIRLLISKTGELTDSENSFFLESTRLGEGAEKEGYLQQEAILRTEKGLQKFLKICSREQVESLKIVATSALREAKNGLEVRKRWEENLKIAIRVVSGPEEARLSYLGASADFSARKNIMVIDIGGGSTDFAYYIKENFHAQSFPLGSLRLRERPELLQDFSIKTEKLFTDLKLSFSLIGVGGTITNLASIKLGLRKYDPAKVHGTVLKLREIENLYAHLSSLEPEERKKIAGIQKERADHILEGMKILLVFMRVTGAKMITVSEKDILFQILE